MIHDLIPMIPDASMLGVVGVPFLRKAYQFWKQPSFWPDTASVRLSRSRKNPNYDPYAYHGGSEHNTEYFYQDWIVIRRKRLHKFPVGSDKHDKLPTKYDPDNRYIGVAPLPADIDDDTLTTATAEAKRLAREFRKLDCEPTPIERAKRLLSS